MDVRRPAGAWRIMALACALVLGGLVHAQAGEREGRPMAYTEQEQRNLELVRGLFRDVLEPMSSKNVDRYISPDYIQHNQRAEPGRDGLKRFLDVMGPKNPNPTHDIKRMFADGDHVIVHYNFRRGDGGLGYAVMDIFRIEDGLIKEHWDVIQEVPTESPNPNSPF